MFIPLGTDRPLRHVTLVTYLLLGVNILVFVMLETLRAADPGRAEAIENWGILEPMSAGQGPSGFHWWALITYAFFHAGYMHLLGNMLVLYVFGPNIEDRLGKIGFAVFYLAGAAVAGTVHIFYAKSGVLGASGAIAACTGAFLVMFPRTQIKVFSFLIYVGLFSVSAWWFIIAAVLWDFYSTGFGRGDNVAHLAHLGGYGFGIIVAMTLLWLKLVPREPYDLFSMGKQAYRRRQFKEAGLAAQAKVRQHWDKTKGSSPQSEADDLAAARAAVTTPLSAGNLPDAAKAYKILADNFANLPGATTMSRRAQYDLGNHFYQTKDTEAAVFAYERFLEAYPKDSEAPNIRLLLGMIHARTLNDPVKAKSLIGEAIKDLDEDNKALAKKELESLG